MLRTLNYTGRKRILRKDVSIQLRRTAAGVHSFDADLRLSGYSLPAEAHVYLEAYRQTKWMRFDFGSANSARPPSDCILGQFDTAEHVLFRVKVTSADGSGLLLAEAHAVPLLTGEQTSQEKVPLLPVRPDDLGHEVWRLDFSDDRPLLLVNRRIEDSRAFTRNPFFVAVVLPDALRQVLMRILCIDKHYDTDDPDDWRSRWLLFATSVLNMPTLAETGVQSEMEYWIDAAVESFCRRFRMMDRFNISWSSEA